MGLATMYSAPHESSFSDRQFGILDGHNEGKEPNHLHLENFITPSDLKKRSEVIRTSCTCDVIFSRQF